MNWMKNKNTGRIIKTKTGKLGIIFDKDLENDTNAFLGGKVLVNIIDGNYKPTGEKIIAGTSGMEFIGYVD